MGTTRRVYRSLSTRNYSEALNRCKLILEKEYHSSKSDHLADTSLLLSSLLDSYLVAKSNKCSNTRDIYNTAKLKALTFFGSTYLLKKLSITELLRYQSQLQSEGLAPSTQRMYLNFIKMSIAFATNNGTLKVNPIRNFDLPRSSRSRLAHFSSTEVESILSNLTEPNYGVVLALAFTGQRKHSVISLQWSWINFESNCITFPGGDGFKRHHAHIVPLAPRLKSYLLGLKSTSSTNATYVFTRDNGISPLKTMRSQFERVLKLLSLKGSLHTLRHTFATIFMEKFPNELHSLSNIIGWSDPRMALRYAHQSDSFNEISRNKMNQLYGPSKDSSTPVSSLEGSEHSIEPVKPESSPKPPVELSLHS
jgi:integrase/recombinase XerD